MSLELINTFGTLLTVAIIAATAIAAIVQLRHLRAGNQINAMLAIAENAMGQKFRDALHLCDRKLAGALADQLFREYDVALLLDHSPPEVGPEYVEVRRAAILVANTLEQLGVLVRGGVVEKSLFLDQYYQVVIGAWGQLEPFVALAREAISASAAWESFEYLTVLAQDWQKAHPQGNYPKGLRRLELHNPWPLPPMPATA
jgi:hypothetical protein